MIDADTHVIETERTWDYLEGADRQYRPVPLEPSGDDPRRWWLLDGELFIRGGAPRKNPVPVGAKEMSDLGARLADMDRFGVELQVLYPTFFLHPVSKKPEIELALARSYNRWLAEIYGQEHRFRWVVVPPLQTMAEALEELEFGRQHGAVGVFMRGFEGDRTLNNPYFYPLYAKARELDMPLCIHAGNGSWPLHETYMQDPRNGPFLSLITPVFQSFQCLIMSEVPERFPGLRFGFIEASSQWLSFILHDSKRRMERQGNRMKEDPLKAYNLYVSIRTDDDLPYILQYSGPDTLLIGTDYGHTDLAAEIDALDTLRRKPGVEPGVIERILEANPRAFYSL